MCIAHASFDIRDTESAEWEATSYFVYSTILLRIWHSTHSLALLAVLTFGARGRQKKERNKEVSKTEGREEGEEGTRGGLTPKRWDQ